MEYGIADRISDLTRDKWRSVGEQSRIGMMNEWQYGLNELDMVQFRRMVKDGAIVIHQIKEPDCYVLVARLAR